MFYQTNMIRYEEFICNQIFLLEQEKEFDRENQKDERKKYGKIYGKVINQSVPPYFGVTVTFRLKISGEQGTGNPFKQGCPIIIEVISTKEKFQGTVMLVRLGKSANYVSIKTAFIKARRDRCSHQSVR